MRDLDDLRGRIDAIDRELVDLLADRLDLALEIGREKQADGMPFFDPARERKVLEKISRLAAGRYPPERIEAIFREIISATRTAQAAETVLVLGAPGSSAHQAAHQRFGTASRYEWTARDEDVFAHLDSGACDYAVVALEGRSLEASLDRLDQFLHSEAEVFAEIQGSSRLSVFLPPGVEGESLAPDVPVFATAPVLARATRWLQADAPHRPVHVVAGVEEGRRRAEAEGAGLIGPPVVGAVPGWRALPVRVEDDPEIRRRFFVLSRNPAARSGRDRTLLLLVLANRSGALHGVTEALVAESINLTWLEPKATHLGGWDHLFLLEIEGHREDPAVARVLGSLARRTEVFRVLGSYPAEMS